MGTKHLGRNSHCYCGSRKKYKKCCGQNDFLEADGIVLTHRGNPVQVYEVAFPICLWKDAHRTDLDDEEPADDLEFEVIGTGFYVNPDGGFVTAHHVLVGEDGQLLENLFALHIAHDPQTDQLKYVKRPRDPRYIALNLDADVAFGRLRGLQNSATGEIVSNYWLPVDGFDIRVRTPVASFGYPDGTFTKSGLSRLVAERRFQWVRGSVAEVYPHGRGWGKRPGPGFLTDDMEIPGGASGGPIINSKGHVIGLNSESFGSGTQLNYGSRMKDVLSMQLTLPDGSSKTLFEAARQGHLYAHGLTYGASNEGMLTVEPVLTKNLQ